MPAERWPGDDLLDDRPDRRLWRADHERVRAHDLFRCADEPGDARWNARQSDRAAALAFMDRARLAGEPAKMLVGKDPLFARQLFQIERIEQVTRLEGLWLLDQTA